MSKKETDICRNISTGNIDSLVDREKDEVSKKETDICREYLKKHCSNAKFASTGKGSDALGKMTENWL